MKLLNDKNKFYPIGENLVAQLNITKIENIILESQFFSGIIVSMLIDFSSDSNIITGTINDMSL